MAAGVGGHSRWVSLVPPLDSTGVVSVPRRLWKRWRKISTETIAKSLALPPGLVMVRALPGGGTGSQGLCATLNSLASRNKQGLSVVCLE